MHTIFCCSQVSLVLLALCLVYATTIFPTAVRTAELEGLGYDPSEITRDTKKLNNVPYPDDYKLKFSQVVFRHGDRVPIPKLPCDTEIWECRNKELIYLQHQQQHMNPTRMFKKVYMQNQDLFPGNCYSGQLTEKGVREHLKLGETIRRVYVNKLKFLGENFNPDEVYVRSTNIDRTLESVQAQLHGMYPNLEEESPSSIDINMVEDKTEYMFANAEACPRIAELKNELKNTPEYQAYLDNHKVLFEKLYSLLQMSSQVKNFSYSEMQDVFVALISHNRPLPKGVTPLMVNETMTVAAWQAGYIFSNPLMSRLAIGLWFKEMLQRINDQVNNVYPQRKYVIYSAHDSTLLPILNSLKLFRSWPHYSSYMFFELFEDKEGENVIRVVYNGDVQTLPFCGSADGTNKSEFCKLADFQKLVEQFVPKNYAEECRAQHKHKKGSLVDPAFAFYMS